MNLAILKVHWQFIGNKTIYLEEKIIQEGWEMAKLWFSIFSTAKKPQIQY